MRRKARGTSSAKAKSSPVKSKGRARTKERPSPRDCEHLESGDAVGEHIPGDAVGEHIPGDDGGEHIPGDAGGEHIPGDAGGEHIPGDAVGEHIPGDAVGEHIPGDDGGEHIPGDDSPHLQASCQHMQKRIRISTDLTEEEENFMVEWLKEHPILYNKKLKDFRDKNKKSALWFEQAEKMGKSVKIIQTWYDSIRTRYSRILKDGKASGTGLPDLTERQHWIYDNFIFLQPYIAPCPRRNIASINAKVVASAACALQPPTQHVVPSGEEGESEDEAPSRTSSVSDLPTSIPVATPSPTATAPVLLDVRPRRNGARKAKAQEERALSTIAESRDMNCQVQSQILQLLQTQESATERTTYADWCKQVMVDLQPSLWRQFQQEQTNLILRYSRLNDQPQRSYTPLPQQPTQQSSMPPPQHSFTQPSTSQHQYQWQPPPQQWPSQVTPAPSVLHSQSTDWVARQFQGREVATYTTLLPQTQSPATTSTTGSLQEFTSNISLSDSDLQTLGSAIMHQPPDDDN